MERYTTKSAVIRGEYRVSPATTENCIEAINKLGRYEDEEEKGLLVHLPCKVGDTVYILAGSDGYKYEQEVCEGFYIGDDGIVQIRVSCKKYNHGTYGVMGKTVFLTLEAAQQALKERTDNEQKRNN